MLKWMHFTWRYRDNSLVFKKRNVKSGAKACHLVEMACQKKKKKANQQQVQLSIVLILDPATQRFPPL